MKKEEKRMIDREIFTEAIISGIFDDSMERRARSRAWEGGVDIVVGHKSSNVQDMSRYASGKDEEQAWENARSRMEQDIKNKIKKAQEKPDKFNEIVSRHVIESLTTGVRLTARQEILILPILVRFQYPRPL